MEAPGRSDDEGDDTIDITTTIMVGGAEVEAWAAAMDITTTRGGIARIATEPYHGHATTQDLFFAATMAVSGYSNYESRE